MQRYLFYLTKYVSSHLRRQFIYEEGFGVKILVEYCRMRGGNSFINTFFDCTIFQFLEHCYINSSKGIYFQGPSHQQNSYKKPQHNSLIIFQIKVDYMTFHLDYTTLGSQFQGRGIGVGITGDPIISIYSITNI